MGTAPSNDVFISYRRDVTPYLAMALWQNLTARGIDVFYDIESIGAGHFDDIILAQIGARPYMVPVFAPGTLNECVNEDDWLRRELVAGLAEERILVPVHTPEFDFGDIELYLPGEVSVQVMRFQMLEIPPRFFKYAIEELAEKYLVPVDLPVRAVPDEAAAVADRQAAGARKLAQVTAEDLASEEYFAIAYDATKRGDLIRALEAYSDVIRLNPESAAAFNNRSIVRRQLGDLDGALADAAEAVFLKPESAAALDTRGEVRQALGDLRGALDDYESALRLRPTYEAAVQNRERVRAALAENEEQR